MSKYYVVGQSDTRGEFYPKGVTKNLIKANKYKQNLASQLYPNARQWIEIKEVKGIK